MLGGNYDDSDSEDHGGKIINSDEEDEEKGGAAPDLAVNQEDGEEEDEEDDEESDRLTSAAKAFKSLRKMGEEALSFKKFEKDHAKTDRVRSHQMSLDRVTSASAATLRGQGWLPGADAKEAVLPSEIGVKRRADEQEGEVELKGRGKGQEKGGDKGKGKGKMTVKELTKLKRFKGQSGLDHNGKVWKPEIWMQMRNEFD
mmetsp:Transcript_56294/g.132027  ORF Transcript_56294/g.132027 Transcript_56294/m.132027 type:complete len:200 (-) Transcript_56294:38-637(-)